MHEISKGEYIEEENLIMLLYLIPAAIIYWGFPGGSNGEESVCNAGDLGSIPVLGRFPGEGNGTPLQYSCLENSMDRGAWRAIVHGCAKNRTQLSFTGLHQNR